MEANHQSYYVYSNAVFRVNPLTKQLYLRERQTGGWKEIKDPVMWEGIMREGDKVSEQEAERLFHIFREKHQ